MGALFNVLRGELVIEAKAKKETANTLDTTSFQEGYLSVFHRVITLMQQQADIFDVPLTEIGIDNLKESDLITKPQSWEREERW